MNRQENMVKIAYEALDEKKGEDICIIGISEISVMADYFVIATGASTPQIQALVNNVQEKMHEEGIAVKRIEGTRGSSWILMDYGDVIIHIFNREDREFYDLEHIWRDGKRINIEEVNK